MFPSRCTVLIQDLHENPPYDVDAALLMANKIYLSIYQWPLLVSSCLFEQLYKITPSIRNGTQSTNSNNATFCLLLPYRCPRYSRHQWEGRQRWGARQWGTSGTTRSIWSNWCTRPQWRRADLRPLGEDHLPHSAGDRAGLRWTHSRELVWPHRGRGKLHLCGEGCKVSPRSHGG